MHDYGLNPTRSPEKIQRRQAMGERLRLLRLRLGPEGFATTGAGRRWFDCSFSSWYRYEMGTAIPGDLLCRVIVETGVSPSWLLTGEGEMVPGKDWQAGQNLVPLRARRPRPGS